MTYEERIADAASRGFTWPDQESFNAIRAAQKWEANRRWRELRAAQKTMRLMGMKGAGRMVPDDTQKALERCQRILDKLG